MLSVVTPSSTLGSPLGGCRGASVSLDRRRPRNGASGHPTVRSCALREFARPRTCSKLRVRTVCGNGRRRVRFAPGLLERYRDVLAVAFEEQVSLGEDLTPPELDG